MPSGDKGHLGDKFEGYTRKPSKDVWSRIEASQADAKGKGRLAPIFATYNPKPHSRVWRRISASLHPQRRVAIWGTWSVAATVALLLAMGIGNGWWSQEAPQDKLPQSSNQFAQHQPTQQGSLAEQPCPPAKETTPSPLYTNNYHSPGQRGHSAIPSKSPQQLQPRYSLQLYRPDQLFTQTSRLLDPLPVEAQPTDLVQQDTASSPQDFPDIDLRPHQASQPTFALNLGSSLAPVGSPMMKSINSDLAQDDLGGFTGGGLSNGLNEETTSGGRQVRENYQTPLSFGLYLDRALSRRWTLGPGLAYTLMRSSLSDGSRLTRQYLGIGTRATFAFIQGKRANLYALGGLQLDLGVAQAMDRPEPTYLQLTGNLRAGNHFSAQFGVGANHAITRYLSMYAQVAGASYLLQSRSNLWSQKPLWPMVQVGLSLKL